VPAEVTFVLRWGSRLGLRVLLAAALGCSVLAGCGEDAPNLERDGSAPQPGDPALHDGGEHDDRPTRHPAPAGRGGEPDGGNDLDASRTGPRDGSCQPTAGGLAFALEGDELMLQVRCATGLALSGEAFQLGGLPAGAQYDVGSESTAFAGGLKKNDDAVAPEKSTSVSGRTASPFWNGR